MQGGMKSLRGEGSTRAGHARAPQSAVSPVSPSAPSPSAAAAATHHHHHQHQRRPMQSSRRRAAAAAAASAGPQQQQSPATTTDPVAAPAAASPAPATALAASLAPARPPPAAPSTTSPTSVPPPAPDRRAVAVSRTITLPPQPDWPSAAALLATALRSRLPLELGAGAASGLLRLEVGLPRGSPPSALRWLRGQQETSQQGQQQQQQRLCLYFSGRHSTGPPSTPGAALAEAGSRGWLALAGVGAAWLWRGEAGDSPSVAVRGAGRFLSEAQPRVRVLGGARFDGTGAAAAAAAAAANGGNNSDAAVFSPEWRPFGAYTFAIPSVELTEALEANILAVTVAWDGRQQAAAAAAAGGDNNDDNSASSTTTTDESRAAFGAGPTTLEAAIEAALSVVEELNPPAGAAAPAPAGALGPPRHSPTREQWGAVVADVVQRLGVMRGGAQEQQRRLMEQQQQQEQQRQQEQEQQQRKKGRRRRRQQQQQQGAAASSSGGAATATPLPADLARSEFMAGGQPSLDALLAAIDAAGSDTSSPPPDAKVAFGAKAAATTTATAASAASAILARPLSPLPEPSAQDAQLTKVVLARRSTFDLGPATNDAPPAAFLPSSAAAGAAAGASPVVAAPAPAPVAPAVAAPAPVAPAVAAAPPLRPLELLEALQERDPHSYQACMALPSPTPSPSSTSGPCFVACTPERLYVRTGARAASEAVAGTRPRGPPGDVEADFFLGLELLSSAKDHDEFSSVRGAVRSALADLGADVAVEVAKSVIKQGGVQHLYARVAAALPRSAAGGGAGVGDAQLLAALHPTPAVCGRPRAAALAHLRETEPFDRGFYAGPFGWVSGASSEFVVAIRSALFVEEEEEEEEEKEAGEGASGVGGGVGSGNGAAANSSALRPRRRLMHAYTGVGIVRGSSPDSEWAELDLKLRQVTAGALLLGAGAASAATTTTTPTPPTPAATALPLLLQSSPFHALPNANACWAALIVEELCRLGVTTFAVAPGSRSSPLALAAARHPRARLRVGLDERSLGFWAVGFGRASRQAVAVVTSSGTAVANLLPAAVEAAQSHVPLVLLTADRPSELRGTGANQTIDQVGIFGTYARWSHDLAPPCAEVPGRSALSVVDLGVRAAMGVGMGAGAASPGVGPPGPVHLNVQLREPLAPHAQAWDPRAMLAGLDRWLVSGEPLTAAVGVGGAGALASSAALSLLAAPAPDAALTPLLRTLRGARRGLLVVGELPSAQDARAAAELAHLLGWPVAADVLSGMRVGARAAVAGGAGGDANDDDASSSSSSSLLAPPALLSHFDHVLLPPPGTSSPEAWWDALRPDVVLQLGTHLTSKRLGQFLERAASATATAGLAAGSASGSAASSSSPPALWVHLAPHAERHDPAFLVTHRVVATPQDLCAAVAGAAAAQSAAAARGDGKSDVAAAATTTAAPLSEYARLLAALDRAAAAAIDSELAEMAAGWADEAEVAAEEAAAAAEAAAASAPPPPPPSRSPILSEAHIARVVSAELPPGHGLYLGNSMPIRDMDMFAAPRPAVPQAVAVAAAPPPQAAASVATAATATPASLGGGSSPGATFDEDDLARADSDAEMLAALGNGSSNSSQRPATPLTAAASSSSASLSSSSLAAPAAPPPPPAAAAPFAGAPIGANRGASGIDGVLSSAAGFAAGLRSPSTLVVGDLSFLHDTNGLALLRGAGGAGGDGDAPLTVVVVNNGGGGIFSFLPVASAVDRESFERLWATPQHADLGALCRAHGVPHQRVGWGGGGGARGGAGGGASGDAATAASPAALSAALAAAWGLGRHSVVEVFPTATRSGNVELHRRVQRRVAKAVQAAHAALVASAAGEAALASSLLLAPPLRVRSASVSRYELPLVRPLTTAVNDSGVRRGALLRIELEEEEGGGSAAGAADATTTTARSVVFAGVGDAAPLPGLHRETFEQACAQLELLAASLPGVPVPRELGALLPHASSSSASSSSSPSSLEGWLRRAAALLPPTPAASSSSSSASLLPSVAFALEGALLTALAAARGGAVDGTPDVAALLQGRPPSAADAAANPQKNRGPLACALLSPKPGTAPEIVAAEAAALLAATGAEALKVKVGRPGSDPAAEGAALGAIRRAVGPRPALRADANRAWSLPDAMRFCRAARDSGADLEYLEEPTRSGPGQWRALRRRVESDGGGPAPPLAADESVDDGSLEAAWRGEYAIEDAASASAGGADRGGGGVENDDWLPQEDDEDEDEDEDDGDDGEDEEEGLSAPPPPPEQLQPGDVAAVVLKPSVLGGVSATWRAARRARLEARVGKVVVSSAFESSAGVALLAHLAAALDAQAGAGVSGAVAHGLGTLEWFREDVVLPSPGTSLPLPLEPVSGPADAAGMRLERASAVLCAATAAAAAADGGAGNAPVLRAWEPRVSERVMRCELPGEGAAAAYDVRVVEVLPPVAAAAPSDGNGNGSAPRPTLRRPVVLLHGFLGDAREWLPLARALASAGHPCLALDLPGHGRTRPVDGGDEAAYSLPAAAALARQAAGRWLESLPPASAERPLLVGYSLGGRVALQALADMAGTSGQAESSNGNGASSGAAAAAPWAAAVALLSASPGIRAEDQRRQRAARDDELADTLELGGLPAFVDAWYEGPLWAPLRRHGAFARVKARRRGDGDEGDNGADAAELARALRAMSAGRMQPLWREASSGPALSAPMLLVAGAEDGKFVSIHRQLGAARRRSVASASSAPSAAGAAAAATNDAASPPALASASVPDMLVEVPGAGHSVHVEAPTAVLDALAAFLGRLEEEEQEGGAATTAN